MPDFINIGWDLFLTVNQAFTPTQLRVLCIGTVLILVSR